MYIMIAVMGSCLTGARATSHAFLSLRTSISSLVGWARTTVFEEDCCFCRLVNNRCEEGLKATYLASCRC
jgi:hypothetical protein